MKHVFLLLGALAALTLRAEMSSVRALEIVLNSKNSTDVKTFEAAKAIVERDAKAGRPLQRFVIGVTTEDKGLAQQYLTESRGPIRQMAEKNNNSLAWYLLSLENNDMNCLRKAADGGNVQALNAFGMISLQEALRRHDFTGISTNELEKTLKHSFECFSKTAAQRDTNGFINLGTCYLRGFGCKADLALAFACFKAAAEAGHPEGMDNVSGCYQFGHGVKKDAEQSLYWAMRGRAARGDKAAAKWLEERK